MIEPVDTWVARVVRDIELTDGTVLSEGDIIRIAAAPHGWHDMGIYVIVEADEISYAGVAVTDTDFHILSPLELLGEQAE